MDLSHLLDRAAGMAPDLVALRRDLHRHPELAFAEIRTARIAAAAVAALGFTVRAGVARTGVVADLVVGRGAVGGGVGGGPAGAGAGAGGPTVALRADMDALPIHEQNTHDFVSTVDGVMHACGHDAHVAGLIGAARILAGLEAEGSLPPGRIRLLFQPSEESMDAEGKSGGRRMVEEGAMEGVDAVVGLHVAAHLEAGKVFMSPGPFFAGADTLRIEVEGRAAHAALPHEGVDALLLASQGVVALQQIVSRRIAPGAQGVISLGTIEGGDASNILCDRVTLTGTLRWFDPEVRETLRQGIVQTFAALEVQHPGARARVSFVDGYPPVVNDPEVTRRVARAVSRVAGPSALAPDGGVWMTAEDFSFLADASAGAFLWLGAACTDPRAHHHPRFDIDESVLPLGAAILSASAVELLSREPLEGGSS
jgi:amidohydrolase